MTLNRLCSIAHRRLFKKLNTYFLSCNARKMYAISVRFEPIAAYYSLKAQKMRNSSHFLVFALKVCLTTADFEKLVHKAEGLWQVLITFSLGKCVKNSATMRWPFRIVTKL